MDKVCQSLTKSADSTLLSRATLETGVGGCGWVPIPGWVDPNPRVGGGSVGHSPGVCGGSVDPNPMVGGWGVRGVCLSVIEHCAQRTIVKYMVCTVLFRGQRNGQRYEQ